MNVVSVNDAPLASSDILSVVVLENTTGEAVDITGLVSDVDSVLTFSLDEVPDGVTVSLVDGAIQFQAMSTVAPGSSFTIRATDGEEVVTIVCVIDFRETNSPQVVKAASTTVDMLEDGVAELNLGELKRHL